MVERVVATPSASRASAALTRGNHAIALFQVGGAELAGLGHALPHVVGRLPTPPSKLAWDFLSFALAVYGADRFMLRSRSSDGWTRLIALDVDVEDPAPWRQEAKRLEKMLRFLTGDIWYLSFHPGGYPCPVFQGKLSDRDCACLFSGGLDSLIGALDLIRKGQRPLLVSQASPKEGQVQDYLVNRLCLEEHRFRGRVTERGKPPYEPSSRARSILFLAYGLMVATALPSSGRGKTELFIPENGFISLNPPLTPRRMGSLSTRTTHPHFISSLQAILDNVGMGVRLSNPWGLLTKGEMLKQCDDERIAKLSNATYSCGKGKRLNRHCGRCVPCLVRRAAFFEAGIDDRTPYAAKDLRKHSKFDDIFAVRLAIAARGRNMALWAAQSGPLPDDHKLRAKYIGVADRGLTELQKFCKTIKWL